MAASDLKTLIENNWDATIIVIGLIKENSDLPLEYINDGIAIVEEQSDWHPAGLTQKQTDALGGDIFRLYFIHSSVENCRKQLAAIIKIADTFTGNAVYNRLYPRSNEFVVMKQWNEMPLPQYHRICEMPILCNKNNVNIYT